MSEKTTLLPTAPVDDRFPQGTVGHSGHPEHTSVPLPRLVIYPGLEFQPQKRSKYGMHSLGAAIFILIAFILVEFRDCNWGFGIDLDKLQALHLTLMVFTFVLYLLSLFGIADFVFQFKYLFVLGLLMIYVFIGLMIWMTYEAAMNPCVSAATIPIDLSVYSPNKNVISRGDGVGIVVLLLDIFATLLTISAAANFYKRY